MVKKFGEATKITRPIVKKSTSATTNIKERKNAKLLEEVEVVTEFSRKTIAENAHTGMNQEEFDERNNRYLERYQQARARIEFLELEKQRLIAKSKILDRFIEDIRNRPLVIAEWEESLWFAVIDRVVVNLDAR